MNIIEIHSLEREELAVYSRLSEKELYRYREPKPGFFVAESPNVIMRAMHAGYQPESFLVETSQLPKLEEILGNESDVPVYTGPLELLKQITGYEMTRGVLSLMNRTVIRPASELLRQDLHRIAVLEDVMNPTNVGAIFRSAAALGVEAVFLTKGSSDPLYRRAARVSMGTVFQVPWAWIDSENWVDLVKQHGYTTVAMALRNDTKTLGDPLFQTIDKLAVVLGTEGEGLREETIKACDATVKIPMTNGVDSLNVAAASAVAFWELCGTYAEAHKTC